MKKIQTFSTSAELEAPFPRRPVTLTPIKSAANSALEDLPQKRTLNPVWIDECFLSPEDFRVELRREKRRVERSGAPLSIALLKLHESVLNDKEQIRDFLKFLSNKTRETDIKGWVDPVTLGLILPDTNGPAMDRCIELINKGLGRSYCTFVKGIYPDSIFQSVLDENKGENELCLLDLDQVVENRPVAQFFKRILDLVGALTGLLLFSPLMALTAAAIKVSSPGPVIFKQIRVGRRGKRFYFYKFRSMQVNNDDRIHREYLAKMIEGSQENLDQGEANKPMFKIKNDSRITPVGKIIRKLSIDELPQFFNVLKGEMSLVGPRPPIPYEVEKYKSWHLRRILEIKPGITGLWQVDGRSRTSFDEMVRLDLRYVKDWSFWMDIKILLKTVRAVLETRGAA
jgi:lipopolysaccharide/colanic/teichoic acid biosynthesis glycosyltransferase